jgi:hypothetical protein
VLLTPVKAAPERVRAQGRPPLQDGSEPAVWIERDVFRKATYAPAGVVRGSRDLGALLSSPDE